MTKSNEQLSIPRQIADEINLRSVNAMRVNVGHAGKLHEHGEEYCISNHLDIAIRGWLMYHVVHKGLTPSGAMKSFVAFTVEAVFPHFLAGEGIKEQLETEIAEEPEDNDAAILSRVNELLQEHGMEPIIVAGSLPEIIEQLQGMDEAEGQTKQ